MKKKSRPQQYLIVDDSTEAFVCSSNVVNRGAYGEIRECDNGKVLKTAQSFHREFEFMQRVRSDKAASWVRMYRVATPEPNVLAMDTVHSTLDKVRIPSTETNGYAHRLIRAMKDFHKRTEYTHNDIKPENVGVMKDGAIKLIDLGSVVHKDAGFEDVPQTLLYTAIMDDDMERHEVRVKSDYWAMGCTLFEMVVVSNRESLRCSMDRHLFFRGDVPNFRTDMSFGLIIHIRPRDLQYILGLRDTFDGERVSPDFLKRKRELFGMHPIGKKIYALMCVCFDSEKFDGITSKCPTQEDTHLQLDTQRSSPQIVQSCPLNPQHKPFVMTQRVDRAMIKQMRDFLKSAPSNYKWGDNVTTTGGAELVPTARDPKKVVLNHVTLKAIRHLVRKHDQ